jgi:hypothetical protein
MKIVLVLDLACGYEAVRVSRDNPVVHRCARKTGVASILRTGVQIDFCPENTDFVPKGLQTQPGVLTPGTDKKGTRPEGGGREAFSALDAERDPQRISAAPSGRDLLSMCPGVETPGSVL